ncbi:uncharacterized protein [Panulirus ornatus]|uniref:uncharacterized protein n=1 Tax=Panulirus ornatus TaxID=150431 RepID=UPI003A8ADFE3
MTDPFVQRMMARSQARRAGLNRNMGSMSNKENVGVSASTRSRLKQINSLYSDDLKQAASPLQTSNLDSTESLNIGSPPTEKKSNSPNKITKAFETDSGQVESPQKAFPVCEVQGSTSRKPHLSALARRCQEMKAWDDDYSHHPTNHNSQVEVEGTLALMPLSDMHSSSCNLHASNTVSKVPSQVEGQSGSKTNESLDTCPSLIKTSENNKPKYYFGEGVPYMVSGGKSSKSLALSTNLSMASSNDLCTSSTVYPHTPQSKYPSESKMSRNKMALHQTKSPASPTKKLSWDQGMLKSLINANEDLQEALEAQGFTPSESHSRLYYDFKKDHPQTSHPSPAKEVVLAQDKLQPSVSPSKVRGMSLAEFVRSTSPSKMKSPATEKQNPASSRLPASRSSNASLPLPPPPPVVVSCLPKSPCPSPTCELTRMPSPETQPLKECAQDSSPSKVGEMRSRWEQHIRQASPERADRSCSPRKTMPRSVSPRKIPSVQSSSNINQLSPKKTENPATVHSPSKNSSHAHSQSPQKYLPDQGGFSRFGPERKSWRDLSPHKPKPVGEVVKGEAPVPDAVPLVNQPFMSSVRERAAAFNNAGGREPQKDPAEMSVQERLALFNKKQGAALVPKAPFGQPVPIKTLQREATTGIRDTSSKPTVAHSQPVQKPAKRVALEPSPAITQKLHQIQKGNKSPSPDRDESSSFQSQRKLFENVKDNWRENEINSKVQTERQREIDLLLNRFKKPKQAIIPSEPTVSLKANAKTETSRRPEESESEYLESDESFVESTTSDEMSLHGDMPGPPKPPRLFLNSLSSAPLDGQLIKPPSPPPPPTHQKLSSQQQISHSCRINLTKAKGVDSSPKKEFVPKVKPGCLFPSLSDFESHSEAADSQDEEEIRDSSFSESVLTCASIESLGQKIKRKADCAANEPLSVIDENKEFSQSAVSLGMSDSTVDALGAIDDAIDEALSDDPTPPKRLRSQDDIIPGVYKTPKINRNSTTGEEDPENPLAHSISMYRKQRPEVTCTPVRKIIHRPDLSSPTPEPVSPSVTVSARIRELQEEVSKQQRVIAQASNAVTVVLQCPEQQGTPQHVEAEKLLLLSCQKRQTAMNEIQLVKSRGALGQQSWTSDEESCMGSISISNISVPLKQSFLQKGMNGDELYHLMVLVKHREQVISSQLLTTPECVVDGAITFPNLMALHHLTSDFNITLEVYALCVHQPRHHQIKKEQSRMKLTPLKRLQKHDSRVGSPSVQSPGGPFAVRTSAFQLVGFTHLSISTLTRNAWTLEKVPFSSPLDGHLLMHVSCSFEGGITERSFLTMFEDIGGFGAWNRRWCVLSGMYLRFWRYPDDETKKEAVGHIDLRTCTTRRVELVTRDVCARQHTFQLTCMRPACSRDVTNLVQEVQGPSVITRFLLSSDSKEERILWCNKLNKSLANIRAWDPDALRPEDYQV